MFGEYTESETFGTLECSDVALFLFGEYTEVNDRLPRKVSDVALFLFGEYTLTSLTYNMPHWCVKRDEYDVLCSFFLSVFGEQYDD